MAYNKYKRKRKDSPAKFINALFGGARRRKEQEAANEDFDEALALKSAIDRMKSVGIHVQELDERKRLAI